jgi:hypothetical protein
VLTHQNDFRKDVLGLGAGLNNRPAAIYVLRSYLRLCLPYTIETQINTTIVTYERGGSAALENAKKDPLINPVRAASMRLAGATTVPAPNGVPVPHSASLPGALGDVEKTLTVPQLERIQTTALCVPKTPQFDTQTRAGVKILEDSLHRPPPADRLSKQDLQLLASAENIDCPEDARNYFELSYFFDGKAYAQGRVHGLKTLLNRAQPTNPDAFADKDSDETLDEATRSKVSAVRKLMAVDDVVPVDSDQITLRFLNRLRKFNPPLAN